MNKPTVAFIPAKCSKTGKAFFIREDFAADGMWVRTYGIPSIPAGENGTSDEIVIYFNNHRQGPQYKCPHCGNKRIFLCTTCGVKACCYDGSSTWHCPVDGSSGIFSDQYADSIAGCGGKGQ